jgi:hypothetical protein
VATMKEQFIELLKADIEQFDQAADILESLIPHLSGDDQKQRAATNVQVRRDRASELRLLLQRIEAEN